MRTNIIRIIIFLAFALIAFDLFYLQVIRGGYFRRLSQNNSTRVISFDGPRGRILDRQGRVLAESVRSFDIAVIPQDMKKKKALFAFLSGVLNVDLSVLESRFQKNRLTPFAPVVLAEGVMRQVVITIEENAYLYPGLVVIESYQRRYPEGKTSAHLLGYVARPAAARVREFTDNGYAVPNAVGYSGMEEKFEDDLRGKPGGREVRVNSRGQQVQLVSLSQPSAGAEVVLTVDSRIQSVLSRALKGRRGAVVVLDPLSGEVLGLVSSPAFDPNDFSARVRSNNVLEYLRDPHAPFINRAVGAQFQPGSVFKIPLLAGGLQEKKITPGTVFNCPGYYTMGNRRYTFPHAWGDQNATQAMAHSANEYFFNIGLLLGPETIRSYARQFGLGERTGLDLPNEAGGLLPSSLFPRKWFKGDTLNMSIGQGDVLATPLQIAAMMAMIENRGRFVVPHLTRTVAGDVRPLKRSSRRPLTLREDVWNELFQSLRSVVKMPTGTAHALDIPGMVTYGKTGTAQTGGGREDHAWFAGVTKTPESRIAYCAFLEHGGSSHNAVLMVREILEMLREEGII
jgi:penicillin-binding protein 2